MNPLNPDQMQLVPARRPVALRRNPDAVARANAAKNLVTATLQASCTPVAKTLTNTREVLPLVLDNGCALVNQGLQIAAAAELPEIPEDIRNEAINEYTAELREIAEAVCIQAIDVTAYCAATTALAVQNTANRVIDSNVCYGDEDSCVSRTTEWIAHRMQ